MKMASTMASPMTCHSRLERESSPSADGWIPVFTGMTEKKNNVCRTNGMFFALVILFFTVLNAGNAQALTNLFFLHHSVGNGLVVEGNMRETIAAYNSAHGTQYGFWDHGYNSDGLRNAAGEETGANYEIPDDNTNPDGLYNLWTSSESQYIACRDRILANHQVIAFKSCYPASHIYDEDTLNTYKSYYLAMRSFFDSHPEKLFVVMSTPPLHRLDTNDTEGYYARVFADWLKGSAYVSGHTNTVCFDLFGYLAGSDNFLSYNYESSHEGSDSHPNSLADQTVGPIFAGFLINSAAAYHSSTSSISVLAIKANGATNEITVNYPDAVSVTVEMNAGGYAGAYFDWWGVAYAHSGAWYYLNSAVQWTLFSGDLALCQPVYQGALFNLPSTPVLNGFTLLRGTYDFWFAVDSMDGILNLSGSIQFDKVTVVVQ